MFLLRDRGGLGLASLLSLLVWTQSIAPGSLLLFWVVDAAATNVVVGALTDLLVDAEALLYSLFML